MFSLLQLWSHKTEDKNISLVFDENGNLGVASFDGCAYIFDPNGNLLNKVCGNGAMHGVSYSNKKFGFVNQDNNVYITDNERLIKKVYVGNDYDSTITMIPNGFVVCWDRCAFFSFDGNKLWDVDVGYVANGPSYYKGYWYVADISWKRLLIIKDGEVVNSIAYDGSVRDTTVCDKYLAVSTWAHLHLYNLSDPDKPIEIWKGGLFWDAYQITFDPHCNYIAVADAGNGKLKIYDINGNLILKKGFDSPVFSVAWWKDKIAVGLNDGRIYVCEVD